MKTTTPVDHLVIVADTLEQGAQWCEATLGVTPGRGGVHPFMGTHNRLLRIDSPAWPRAYLEIIAINPEMAQPPRRRWFDMDDSQLQQSVREQPRLVHFVACTADAHIAQGALKNLGIDAGPLLKAERPSPDGMLRWTISVRDDGHRLFHGGLPTLIEWDGLHPTAAMPASGLTLQNLRMRHPQPGNLAAAYLAIGLTGVEVEEGAPNLSATLQTPKGLVTIESSGV